VEKMKPDKLKIYTDGASRGNPGPGATAFIITDQKGILLRERREFIGTCTNNVAEYKALISALEEAMKLAGESSEITCFSDSQLMISQLKGEYKVKRGHLKELYKKAKLLEKEFKKVEYRNVRRTDPNIRKADGMVNDILDVLKELRRI